MLSPAAMRFPHRSGDVRKFWCLFFAICPIILLIGCFMAPSYGLWFPTAAESPLGTEIDNLFYLILVIVTVVFIGTNFAMCYALWKASDDSGSKAWHMHGSHSLEVLWTIAPAGVLLFISLYQMDVWARFRIKATYDKSAVLQPVAEVTARQFEWRIRYPSPDRVFRNQKDVENWLANQQPDDLYAVNDLHIPAATDVVIHLRTEDVQHAFFVPDLRVKQDALPGNVIPIELHASRARVYELVCAELCGWGHYKMKGRVVADSEADFATYIRELGETQADDGVPETGETSDGEDES